MDQGVFSSRDRAQGYLGTWSIIALQSLPAALKIPTPPQHADTPIFIQKCILEAEAKSSTGGCGLKKSNYKENKGRKAQFGHFHGIGQVGRCAECSVTGACRIGLSVSPASALPLWGTFPSPKTETRFDVRV